MVHFTKPPLALPEHPVEYVVVYPSMVDDEILYFPACNITGVPEDEPANEDGFGLLPETLIAKSEGLLVPPLTVVVTVKNVFEPIGVVEFFPELLLPLPPFEEDDEDDEEDEVEFFAAA
jgi:hypothetical protein